ncbi:uncharacterized protein GBIM_09463 [Gryllus bimaculatus]|nr:uncharacterized protein GBIM_09463 [Gryllus bimaculatus]
MAEGGAPLRTNSDGEACPRGTASEGASIPECAVCLQTCVHPAQLPCGHIFCYLCVKGVANQSKRCAMCRQEIPSDFLEKPQLLEQNISEKESQGFEDGYQWFYEGRNGWWKFEERTSSDIEDIYQLGASTCEILICGELYNIDFKESVQYRKSDYKKKRRIKRDLKTAQCKGVAGLRKDHEAFKKSYKKSDCWWQYDERTSRELEAAYKRGERMCELLIAGFLYVADFDAMLQLRRNDPTRRRRIKRDLATIPKKGVAGLRLDGSQSYDDSGEESHRPKSPTQGTTNGATTPVPPTNTPQTPAGGMASGDTTPDRHESLHQAIEQIRSLSLHGYGATSESSEDDRGSGDENQDLPDFSSVMTAPWVLTLSSDEDQL